MTLLDDDTRTASAAPRPSATPRSPAAPPSPAASAPAATSPSPDGPTADLLGHRRPPRALSTRRFLPWLAGADEQLLRQVPWERTRYSILGAALVVPAVIGTVAVTVMLHMATGATRSEWRFVGAGMAWGVVVLFIDRLLVRSRISYRFEPGADGDLQVRETAPARRGTAGLWTVRIVMAVSLSVFASEPVLAALYGSEAVAEKREQLEASQGERITTARETGATAVAEAEATAAETITPLLAQNEQLAVALAAAQEAVRTTGERCQTENLEGGGGRGSGPGRVYEACLGDLERATQHEAGIRDQLDQNLLVVEEAEEPVHAARAARDAAVSAIEDEPLPSLDELGAWERITLTHEVLDWWYRLSLSVLILCVDALAILGKGLLGMFAHDDLQAMASAAAVAIWGDSLTKRVAAEWAHVEPRPGSGDRLPERNTPTTTSPSGSTPRPNRLSVRGRIVTYDPEPIGRGAFSTVHRAAMTRFSTEPPWVEGEAVVKLPKADPESRRMLEKEVAFYDAHVHGRLPDAAPESLALGRTDDGSPLVVMRHYPRRDLVQFLFDPDGAVRVDVPVWLVLAWLRNLVDQMAELWARGLVHGDGKPDNVLINGPASSTTVGFSSPRYVVGEPGSLRLCDFSSAGPAAAPAVTYTPEYSPPEYETGPCVLTREGDVHSLLGGVGHFIVTGAAPGHSGAVVADMVALNPALAAVMPLVDALATWLDPIPERRVGGASGITAALVAMLDELEGTLASSLDHLILRRAS